MSPGISAELATHAQGQRLYRDGSKLSQPLIPWSTRRSRKRSPPLRPSRWRISEKIVHRYIARRRRLPDRRAGYTQKAAWHQDLLADGEYEDGTLGEIFVDMHRKGPPSAA